MSKLVHERLYTLRQQAEELEKNSLWPAFQKIVGMGDRWQDLPSGSASVVSEATHGDLCDCRFYAVVYMEKIFAIKHRRAQCWEDICKENSNGILIVSTMDSFVKWRAGEIKGYASRLMERVEINLFCMEEYESYDTCQVMAALANLHVKTLLMVGDLNQRIEYCKRGSQRATFHARGEVPVLPSAPYGLADDGEHYASQTSSTPQSSTGMTQNNVSVPEARPWYEWCRSSEDAVLDHCKRCGKLVCDYISNRFACARTFKTDAAVAYNTQLEHVFWFDGSEWLASPFAPWR